MEERDLRTQLAKEQTVMASERTFLSWLRTGLAVVGGGILIIRFIVLDDPLEHMLLLIGGKLLILWGILIFALSFMNFKRQCKEKNVYLNFSANLFISSLVLSLIFISLVLFVYVQKHAGNSDLKLLLFKELKKNRIRCAGRIVLESVGRLNKAHRDPKGTVGRL